MKPVVVIAEDEPRLLAALRFIVEHEGGRVVGCDNGLDALQAIAEQRPALALLDVMMPKLDGLSVTRRVRKSEGGLGLPIVVITALGQADHERKALAAGATRYVRKPFDVVAVRDMIKGYLAAAQNEDAAEPTCNSTAP